jgi:hypothetical protein
MISEGKYEPEYWEKMLKRSFEAGDKAVLLWTIHACLELRRPIPEWARVAFADACEAAERFKIRSWDDVFGRPVPKGTHLKPRKRDAALPLIIFEHVEALKSAGRKVDKKDLFKEVGKEWGINATRVSEIYYAERRRNPRGDASLANDFRKFLKNSGKIS